MTNNKAALVKARNKKDDEYYTRYEDVENELNHYKDYLKDKIIYCPCDDDNSAFVKYLKNNKNKIGYKMLVYTSFKDGFDFRDQDNSFADVIITNPPFSLFIDFIKWVDNKDCIILGPVTALSYKKIFSYFKNRKIKLGVNFHKNLYFDTPDNKDTQINCGWYTTFDVRENKQLQLKTKAENEAAGVIYEKYDNYDAINVNRVKDIPSDYNEKMGVPVTFLEKWDADKYEVIRLKKGDDNKYLRINGKYPFARVIIRKKI